MNVTFSFIYGGNEMATTKIWAVNDSLKRVVDYASNPDKTSGEDSGLYDVIAYTSQELKTDKQLYVTGINCSFSTALENMNLTKKQWGKENGILAFHCVQSFKPGEVSAELAHQIGVEFAQKMFGNRFEVLVSTHLDKAHYHNHIVINSVSFKDGYRYYDNKKNYKKIQSISDAICQKYMLSVIRNPQSKGKHYSEWRAEKEHKPTIRSLIKADVDAAILESKTWKDFISILKANGYRIKYGKHIAVQAKGGSKYIRLRSLSDDGMYTEEQIKNRIYQKKKKTLPKTVYRCDLKKQRKITGFKALYIKYMYAMVILPKHTTPRRVHYLLREDLKYMDKITKEVTLIGKKNINTLDELEVNLTEVKEKLDKCIRERRCIYNKVKRTKDPVLSSLHQQDIAELTQEIKTLRNEVKLYESIKERSVLMKQKLKLVNEDEKRKEKEQWTMEDKQQIR